MIRALVCGRGVHGIILEFLERELGQHSDIIVHDHCTPQDMPDRADEEDADVVLLVVGIPTHDDVARVAEVHERFPQSPIIGVSMAVDERFSIDPLIEAGAARVLVGEETLQVVQIMREVMAQSHAADGAELATTR